MLTPDDTESSHSKREQIVIILGVILVILGAVLNVSILYTIGAILLVDRRRSLDPRGLGTRGGRKTPLLVSLTSRASLH